MRAISTANATIFNVHRMSRVGGRKDRGTRTVLSDRKLRHIETSKQLLFQDFACLLG